MQDVQELFTVKNTMYPQAMIRSNPSLPYMRAQTFVPGNLGRSSALDMRSSLPSYNSNYPSLSIRNFKNTPI